MKVHLDFINGEIQVLIALPSGDLVIFDKKSLRTPEKLDQLIIEKKRRMWNKIRRVEYWLKQLSNREREALFWRFIQHDFEPSSHIQEANLALKWKTLSWEEISAKMGLTISSVREYVGRALEKIQDIVCES